MTTNAPDLGQFRTTREVAEMYGISQRDVQTAINRGIIPAQKVGYFYLIFEPDLPEEWPTGSE